MLYKILITIIILMNLSSMYFSICTILINNQTIAFIQGEIPKELPWYIAH